MLRKMNELYDVIINQLKKIVIFEGDLSFSFNVFLVVCFRPPLVPVRRLLDAVFFFVSFLFDVTFFLLISFFCLPSVLSSLFSILYSSINRSMILPCLTPCSIRSSVEYLNL